MSRHQFNDDPIRLAIGWDAPLATFFLQIWTGAEKDEDEGPSIWLGLAYGEEPSPASLLVTARRYMPTLPMSLGRQLVLDQLATPARPPRPGLFVEI